MLRSLFLILVAALLAGCATNPPPDDPPPPSAPNILLIVADDLGYGDLGSYGQERIQTPRLDALARQGLRFTDFYAGSTVCAPSRAALMTGLHTGHAPIRGNGEVKPMGQRPIEDEVVTVAEVLQDKGYNTALIGKWGLGGPGSPGEPNRQGFDHFFGYLCQRHAHNSYPEVLFRNTERVPLSNVLPEPKREDGAGVAIEKNEHSQDLLTAEAKNLIGEYAQEPFFLAFTVTIPHANNEGKDDGMEVPSVGQYADLDWPERQKQHAAMISVLDEDVGELLDLLEEKGIADNTLVLFTSDNGPHREGGNDPDFNDSNGPLRGIKRDLYEGGIRVPLIARWPAGGTPAGETTDHIGAFWDFFPTFAELSGAPTLTGVDGISMAPVLTGNPSEQKEHEYLYWEFHEGKASKQAVRMGEWKGVRMALNQPLELYNLSEDLGEENNVAAEHPEIVEKIKSIMATARTEHRVWPLRTPTD